MIGQFLTVIPIVDSQR